MEITYLNRMLRHPILRSWTNEGLSLPEIEALEATYLGGKPFPKAYREFLAIAGKHCNLEGIDTGMGYGWMQQQARERLRESGQAIDRPFWVTDQLDGCEQFGFIHLDEDAEDPDVYWCSVPDTYRRQGFPFIQRTPQRTFSALIEALLDRTLERGRPSH